MAEIYPQLPTTVWNGVKQILKRTPRRKLDDSTLAVELGVQQTAAKQYLRQFVILGVLSEEGTPTELADRWRQDDEAAIDAILSSAYPQSHLDLAPRDNLDRTKIIRWFTGQGLGAGSAGNKASTYIMISQPDTGGEASPKSNPPVRRRSTTSEPGDPIKSRKSLTRPTSTLDVNGGNDATNEPGGKVKQRRPDFNVNVQIHISADASVDQIDAIFSSMKRYFDEAD